MFGAAATTDNAAVLLQELGIDAAHVSPSLRLLATTDSRYLRDLKINISNALQAESLTAKEAYLIAFAVAVNEKNSLLLNAFMEKARAEGATDKELAETISCTSLMSANNVYYRFRHFMNEEFYTNAQAGIRMSIMANPILGKELFEIISLVVSAVNGCEMCVTSHEKNIVLHGASKQKIHDSVRLGAVVKSLATLL